MPAEEGDVYRFALVQQYETVQLVNTFAFKIEEIVAPADELEFLTAIFDGATAHFNTSISIPIGNMQVVGVAHTQWQVQKVSPTPGALYTFFPWGEGTLEEELPTVNVAACISRHGSGAGRRQRGRVAIGAIPNAFYNDGELTTTALTALNTWKPNLYTPHSGAGGVFTITKGFWSPAHDGIVNGEPVSYSAQYVRCVNAIVRGTLRTQRSRTVGVGS